MLAPRTSLFRNTWEPVARLPLPVGGPLEFHAAAWHGPLVAVLEGVRSGKWRAAVARFRASGALADKQALPCFTPAGEFPIRHGAFMRSASGVVCLDYDPHSPLAAVAIRDTAARLPFVVASFVSPSGTGCKVLVTVGKVGPWADRYARAAAAVDAAVGYAHDPRATDESRLCYVSDDPDAYINPAPAELRAAFDASAPPPAPLPLTEAGADVVRFTARKLGPYSPGNRAAFLFALACNCNRRGFDAADALAVVHSVFNTDSGGLPATEPARVVRNAYRRGHEHGTYGRHDGRRPAA